MPHKSLLLCLFVIGATLTARPQELRVAAAADLNFALPEVAKAFEAQTGVKVSVSFGSSGNFFAQIQSGAPFDVFCSADMGYPEKLAAGGQALPETLRQYASGRVVLWARKGSGLDFDRDGIRTLLDPAIKKIAIANPEHAPYGRAAVAILRKANIYDQVQSKLVLGENVSQTAQFVTSGNADVALISLSLAQSGDLRRQGYFWMLPPEIAESLPQGAVVLRRSASPKLATKFLDFLSCPAATRILAQYGFDLAKPASADARSADICGVGPRK
jgi:molybdate transport system substrate-binding protein